MNTFEQAHLLPQSTVQDRARSLVEAGVAYAFLESALWSTHVWQFAWALAMLFWVTMSTRRSHRTAAELGVGSGGLRQSLWIVPAAMLLSACMISAASFVGSLHGLRGARTPLWHALLYVAWALVQEFLTMSFIFVRLEDAFEASTAIYCTAALFCLAHIPNPVLMVATLLMGLIFCWLFQRLRNIYPLAISHALLGLSLSVCLPSSITHFMHVGIAWF